MYVDFTIIGLFNKNNESSFYKGISRSGNFEFNKISIFLGKSIYTLVGSNTLHVVFEAHIYKDFMDYKKIIEESIKTIPIAIIINNKFFTKHDIPIELFECNSSKTEVDFIGCHVIFDISETYKDKETIQNMYKR